jgi:hypothetical protein
LDEGAGWLDAAVEVERGLAQLAGARVRALASFARCRPSAWDRQPGERGAASAASRSARPPALTEVSEWAVAEVAARLRLSSRSAAGLLADSVDLAEQLPATLAALEAGDISWLHARALVELLRPVGAEKKPDVESRVLPRAGRQTVAQLRECTKRAIARIDADAAVRRLTTAVRGRTVTRHPGEDGMAVLTALLPGPVARACWEALRAYAQACAVAEDGQPDPRGLDERMADCLADLILRPGADGRSPVQVLLTVIAHAGTLTGTGSDADEPGEIEGETVPAALVRELAYVLELMPRPTTVPPGSRTAGPPLGDAVPAEDLARADDVSAGPSAHAAAADDEDAARADEDPAWADEDAATCDAASSHVTAEPDASATPAEGGAAAETPARVGAATGNGPREPAAGASAALAELLDLRRLTGTALAERPRIAVADQLTGCLLALTDSIELRRAVRSNQGLGPPGATDGYRPSRPLDRFVRLRDRRCRFPGCRARIPRCDLDHRVPYPHGPTAHDNLTGLCEHHHRLSHQAPGWRLGATPDGGLVWTLPGGTSITTVPPRFGTDDGTAPDETASAAGAEAVVTIATPAGAEPIRWADLDAGQRLARLRCLVVPRVPAGARLADGPAPF